MSSLKRLERLYERLFNIEEGIIGLLDKKYNHKYYEELIKDNYEKIDDNKIKAQLSYEEKNINKIIKKYVEIENKICNYDIDILQLIVNYIKIKNNIKYLETSEFITRKNRTTLLFDNLLYYFNFYKQESTNATYSYDYINSSNYFKNKYNNKILNEKIKKRLIVIGEEILIC